MIWKYVLYFLHYFLELVLGFGCLQGHGLVAGESPSLQHAPAPAHLDHGRGLGAGGGGG